MNKDDIKAMKDALKRAPNNIALRLTLALKLFKTKEFDEAEKNYQIVLKLSPDNVKAKQGLIELYFAKQNYSAVIVIAEELVQKKIASEKNLELYAKSLLKQNNITEAQEVYEKLIDSNPFYFDEELDAVLEDKEEYVRNGRSDGFDGFEDEDMDDLGPEGMDDYHNYLIDTYFENHEHLFLPVNMGDFSNIVGLDHVKMAIKHKLRFMVSDDKLLNAYQLPGNGHILMYGPPGCGKTAIVKCLPDEFDIDVLPFELDRIDDPWSFRQEGLLHYYFNIARVNSPAILFIDELESIAFSRDRAANITDRAAVSKVINELAGVRELRNDVKVIGATSMPWLLDFSLISPGRFDNILFVGPPNDQERQTFIKALLSKIKNDVDNLSTLVTMTKGFSYAEIIAAFDNAISTMLYANKTKSRKLPLITAELLKDALGQIIPAAPIWMDQAIEALSTNRYGGYMMSQILTYKKQNNF